MGNFLGQQRKCIFEGFPKAPTGPGQMAPLEKARNDLSSLAPGPSICAHLAGSLGPPQDFSRYSFGARLYPGGGFASPAEAAVCVRIQSLETFLPWTGSQAFAVANLQTVIQEFFVALASKKKDGSDGEFPSFETGPVYIRDKHVTC